MPKADDHVEKVKKGFPRQIGFWRPRPAERRFYDPRDPFDARTLRLPWPGDHVDRAWARTPEARTVHAYVTDPSKHRAQYRGCSTCRLCERSNGSASFGDGTYLWPEGFGHYIEAHMVKPPQAFIDHVIAKTGVAGAIVQPTTGWPNGECVRASYASLLDWPIDRVPRFDPGTLDGKNQIAAERRWLGTLGLDLVIVPGDAGPTLPENLPHLISVSTTRGPHGHRVVGRGGKLAWDPHPGGSVVTKIRAFYFLVPRRPGR